MLTWLQKLHTKVIFKQQTTLNRHVTIFSNCVLVLVKDKSLLVALEQMENLGR